MAVHDSTEQYLETIYKLSFKKDEIHAIDVVRELNFSKPSVSRAIKILSNKGHLIVDANHLYLTDSGKKIAKDVVLKHELIKKMLMDSLDVSEEVAEQDACFIEHVICEDTFQALQKKYKKD